MLRYTVERLLEDYDRGDPVAVRVLTESQLHIVPYANPDGYSHTHTDARLWRKVRATIYRRCLL